MGDFSKSAGAIQALAADDAAADAEIKARVEELKHSFEPLGSDSEAIRDGKWLMAHG